MVETRTSTHQRREDGRGQQIEMFSQRAIAQFGVKAHPLIALTSATTMRLEVEDHRTPEERERDVQRAAEERTHPMFAEAGCAATAPVREGATEMPRPLCRVETTTNLEGVTRSYLYRDQELLVMTPGAMYWSSEDVAAQQQCVAWIAAVLNALACSSSESAARSC